MLMQVCLRDDEIEKLKMLMEEGKERKGKGVSETQNLGADGACPILS
jgi:hypothetical protein